MVSKWHTFRLECLKVMSFFISKESEQIMPKKYKRYGLLFIIIINIECIITYINYLLPFLWWLPLFSACIIFQICRLIRWFWSLWYKGIRCGFCCIFDSRNHSAKRSILFYSPVNLTSRKFWQYISHFPFIIKIWWL
jgi:hypothetical protein